jgi:predicted dehydrogenase
MGLAGAPIMRVAAMASQGRVFRDARFSQEGGDSIYHEGIGTPETGMNEDSSSALLEFANGAKGVYTQVFFSKGKAATRGATISGYRGTVSFDWYTNQVRHVPHTEGGVHIWEPAEAGSHFGGDEELARNFVAVVKGEQKSISPLGHGLESVYACLAAKESAETGTFVDVRPCGLGTARRQQMSMGDEEEK